MSTCTEPGPSRTIAPANSPSGRTQIDPAPSGEGRIRDAPENAHLVAAVALGARSSQEAQRRATVGTLHTNIPLQQLSNPATISQPAVSASQHHSAHQSQGTYAHGAQPAPVAAVTTGLMSWLWGKGCAIWSWIMSIIMLALTAATYLVTKLQSTLPDWQQRQQEWQSTYDYYKYCETQQTNAKPLTNDCQAALEDGVPRPPGLPHSKRDTVIIQQEPQDQSITEGSYSPSRASQINAKVQKGIYAANIRLASAQSIIGQNFPNPTLMLRGFRRRLARFFRGGRHLGTGRQTFGLPTFESGMAAISLK